MTSAGFTGRRLWFVGIGGAGLSAYAQLARAWGAEVGGWDRVRTPYLAVLEGVRVEIGPEPVVPDGWEAVVSSAYPAVPGARRAELLRELVAARRSIVVAGSHGKGTTAAMIAFVLHETGRVHSGRTASEKTSPEAIQTGYSSRFASAFACR